MKKIIFFSAILIYLLSSNNYTLLFADTLSETIGEQLDKIDFSSLNDFFANISNNQIDFYSVVGSMLNGEIDSNVSGFFSYITKILFSNVSKSIPTFLSIVAISILCSVITNLRSSFFNDEIVELINFIGLLCVILLISSEIISFYNSTKIIIENIAKTCEIISPIILTLMIASGGSVSATLYKPAVVFFSTGILNIILKVIMPLMIFYVVFSILNNLSRDYKFNRFAEFITSLIKWILGIMATIFGIFLTVKGISSASFDGISMKIAKYTISNSVPIVGGFIKDGFDIVVAGSSLIKNAVGVGGLISLFFIIITPLSSMIIFSLLFKLVSGIIEPFETGQISSLCVSFSKFISYLIICILIVGLMFFIMILLMIFSANGILL